MWVLIWLRRGARMAAVLATMLLLWPVQADELITLETRPGVQLKALLMTPEAQPKGVLIIYAGGSGTLALGSRFGQPFVGTYKDVFLIRNRQRFVEAGYAVFLPDVPSDREQLNYLYRLSSLQVDDAQAVIDFVRKRFDQAPWILGTSASSLSVAHIASQADFDLAGIVLSASVTAVPSNARAYASHPEGTASTALHAVRVPALVLADQDDGCDLSPPADSAKLMERLVNSPRKRARTFTGGSAPQSKPCFPLAPHGFFGIESEVEQAILEFIEQQGS